MGTRSHPDGPDAEESLSDAATRACASCVTIVLQNTGLAHVEPAQGSLLLATESVFGTAFAILLLGDALTPQLAIGFALVFCAIVISEYVPLKVQHYPRSDE